MTALNGRHLLPTIYIYALLLVLLPLSALSVLAHGDETHTLTDSPIKQQEVQQCLSLSETSSEADSCYFSLCEEQSSYLCAEDILDAVVLLAGPGKAMQVLNSIMKSPLFAIQTDGHQLSHIVGRSTSHHFGLSGKAFIQCPIDFTYGCQHGFFEDALAQHSTPTKAATEICETVPPRPQVNKHYCYHGVGHGFMFHESYHLKNSLLLCDTLPSPTAQTGCWQGVFMENVNGFFENPQENMGFIDTDILAPCNRIENRYRHQCYDGHRRYILHHYNNSVQDASRACLNAGDYIYGCMSALGHLSTNPHWQKTLRGSFNGTFTETAVHICNQFPPEHIETCQIAGIKNLLVADSTNIQQSIDLCLLFDNGVNRCFETIGAQIFDFSPDEDAIIKGCNMIPKEYRSSCYSGATDNQNTGNKSNSTLQIKPINSSSNIFYSLLKQLQTFVYNFLRWYSMVG